MRDVDESVGQGVHGILFIDIFLLSLLHLFEMAGPANPLPNFKTTFFNYDTKG